MGALTELYFCLFSMLCASFVSREKNLKKLSGSKLFRERKLFRSLHEMWQEVISALRMRMKFLIMGVASGGTK